MGNILRSVESKKKKKKYQLKILYPRKQNWRKNLKMTTYIKKWRKFIAIRFTMQVIFY